MKNIFIASLVLTFSTSIIAQKKISWFDAGLKFQFGGSALINQAVSDASNYDYNISYTNSYSIGGKLGMNFGYNGLAVDIMYNQGQALFKSIPVSTEGNSTIDWSSIDIYTLFRNAQNLGYFEIGPKLSLINKVNPSGAINTGREVGDDYSKYNASAVVGFGVNILGQEDGAFSGILGVRLEYGFLDFVSKSGQDFGAPIYDTSIYSNGYGASNPVFAGLVFELNWGIGYYGQSQCGARSKFIMF